MKIPAYVQTLMDRLENAGYQAWAVGGCVRDDALGIEPHDYDLCSSALPDRLAELFSDHDLVRSGMKHGTVGVITPQGVVEITTFRTEGDYSDNRHPGWVRFETEVEADLSRRDFTVNAMAYSPIRGYADPFGGRRDLASRRLRAVGDPVRRFQEDALRILRGARFAARFGMTIEPETLEAMVSQRQLMDSLARERVFSELTQFFALTDRELLVKLAPVLCQVIPELGDCRGFDQKNPNHLYDVYTHIADVTARLPRDPVIRFAGILHDIGKPRCMSLDSQGKGHFYGHAKVSAAMAEDILRRLKAPNAFREDVVWLVEHHMDLYDPEPKLVRRVLSRHGIERVRMLCALQKADLGGKGTGKKADRADTIGEFLRLAEGLNAREGTMTLKRLAVKGNDLMALGYPQTPALGKTLNALLEKVLAGELPNEKQPLLEQARQWLEE
ncbi:MAG: CCA tRNA nucleotidyltransferase [Oscillospiraceae bacterium]|nr:CCA tRNA nucleotidyltransferase [Oscillospiraceae bacterium]